MVSEPWSVFESSWVRRMKNSSERLVRWTAGEGRQGAEEREEEDGKGRMAIEEML